MTVLLRNYYTVNTVNSQVHMENERMIKMHKITGFNLVHIIYLNATEASVTVHCVKNISCKAGYKS